MLESDVVRVGYNGTGIFTHTAGTHTVAAGGSLILAERSGSGTYNLEGGALTVEGISSMTATEYVGYGLTTSTSGPLDAIGEFNQSGGTNTYDALYVAYGSNATGTYNLSDGDLVGGSITVGFGVGSTTTPDNDGEFVQTGGNSSGSSLLLGGSTNGNGTYNLSDGTLSMASEFIGNFGTGVFHQTGGTNTVTNFSMILAVNASGSGTYNLSGGTLRAPTIDADNAGADFNFTGGRLSADTFHGDLTDEGGTLAPGESAGLTDIMGNYTQMAAGTLEIEIDGPTIVDDYDTVSVSGIADLSGMLEILLDATYADSVQMGDSFVILTATSVTGEFSSINGQTIGNGLFFDVTYNADSVVLTAVPELSTFSLVQLSLLGLCFGNWRRHSR